MCIYGISNPYENFYLVPFSYWLGYTLKHLSSFNLPEVKSGYSEVVLRVLWFCFFCLLCFVFF